ncbi:hypothetical protein [Nocardia sp. bgisy134]|uniref:hypothetical protein n=1 Tax=unclassified Nocardia TaxID=2637762 RepID=UPI003D724E61
MRGAASLPCPIGWHDGYTLGIEQIRAHPDYRGATIVQLAEAITETETLTPRLTAARIVAVV